MEFENRNSNKSGVDEMESGQSENTKHVGKTSPAKEGVLSDFNVSGTDLGYFENPEQSSMKVGSPENCLKEFSHSDIGESGIGEAEFEKSEIPTQLSWSVGSYLNESRELALLDFSISETAEIDSEKFDSSAEIHSNLETLESDANTETCMKSSDVFQYGQSSTTPKNSFVSSRRSSIFKEFDPLRTVVLQNSNSGYSCKERGSLLMVDNHVVSWEDSSNNLTNSLISYEVIGSTPLTPRIVSPSCSEYPSCTKSPKMYTEDSFQKALKHQELLLTTEYMKKCIQSEFKFIEQSSSQKHELLNKVRLCKCYSALVSEMLNVRERLNNSCKEIEDKLRSSKEEDASIESDKKICKEDLSEYKGALSEIQKRYKRIESILEIYRNNSGITTENISNVNAVLDEQNNINRILESRMKRTMEKSEKEIEFTKKSSETQVAILQAQVKKAQMKICRLENTLEQAQLENKELASIYEDLMLKLSK